MPDERFEQFYRDTATLTWPASDAIERRGSQRRRRQRLVAGVAACAVVVVVGFAGFALRSGGEGGIGPAPVPPASPQPTPTDTASPSPGATAPSGGSSSAGGSQPGARPGTTTPGTAPPTRPATVPPAAMLRPADVGSGTWQVNDTVEGDWSINFTLSQCPADRQSGVSELDRREQEIARGGGSEYVIQQVSAYPSARVAEVLARLRAQVRACASFQRPSDGGPVTMRILAEGFATADESFIVEINSSGKRLLRGFVRRGTLVTEFAVGPQTEADTQRIGRAAAARLA